MVGVSSDMEEEPMKWRQILGKILLVYTLFFGYSVFVGTCEAAKEQDFLTVSNGLGFLSLVLSCTNKCWLIYRRSASLQRLGRWVKDLKANRKLPPPPIEELLTHMNVGVAVMGAFVWCYWTFKPLLSPLLRHHVPFVTYDQATVELIIHPLQFPVNCFMTATIVYVITGVLHMLSVFRTELFLFAEEWKMVRHRENDPTAMASQLKHCVRYHCRLKNILKDIQVLHEDMFGFQVLITIGISCAFIFTMNKTGVDEALLTLFPVLVAAMIEFGILCWIGEEISHGFSLFHRNIYDTNWYEAPVKDRKQVIVALTVLKTPVRLTGAKIFVASLHTFIMTMREAFSLYTLLKALMS